MQPYISVLPNQKSSAMHKRLSPALEKYIRSVQITCYTLTGIFKENTQKGKKSMLKICHTLKTGISLIFIFLPFSGCMIHTSDNHQESVLSSSYSGPDMDSAEKTDKRHAFRQSVSDFVSEVSEKHHFDKTELNDLFSQIESDPAVIRLVTPSGTQKPKNWEAYRRRMIEPARISAGVRFWEKYEKYLDMAEEKYGVPPHIIVSILGIESVYGNYTGNYRTIDTLATLAFDYPETANQTARKAFFRRELQNLLLLARETGTDPMNYYGSYAGAIGYPQFMPGSVRQYAVDFDGDGKTDLENSPVDAIGSIANFLSRHGWNKKLPIVFPAREISDCTIGETLFRQGLAARFTPDQLRNECIDPGTDIPDHTLFGSIDLPNGPSATEYWIGTDNFFAITHYNRSYFYAMSVVLLGQEILQRKTGQ